MGTASVFASSSTTGASSTNSGATPQTSTTHGPGHRGGAPLMQMVLHKNGDQIATDLHMTKQELMSQLSSGTSLDDLASSAKVPSSQLQGEIRAMIQNELQARVSANKMTQARETQLLKNVDAQLPKWMANTHLSHPARKFGASLHVLTYVASELKMTRAQLVSKLKTGESINQIAAQQGISATTLQNAITQKLDAQISTRVSKLMTKTNWFQQRSTTSKGSAPASASVAQSN